MQQWPVAGRTRLQRGDPCGTREWGREIAGAENFSGFHNCRWSALVLGKGRLHAGGGLVY